MCSHHPAGRHLAQSWSVHKVSKLLAAAGLLAPITVGCLLTINGTRSPDARGATAAVIAGPAFVIVSLTGYVLFSLRPRITLAEGRVVVQNPLRRYDVDLNDVMHAQPGSSGITLELRSGARITAWAVQESNLAQWTNRQTRADAVAACIDGAVKGAATRAG
jgi:hypothetical protein